MLVLRSGAKLRQNLFANRSLAENKTKKIKSIMRTFVNRTKQTKTVRLNKLTSERLLIKQKLKRKTDLILNRQNQKKRD